MKYCLKELIIDSLEKLIDVLEELVESIDKNVEPMKKEFNGPPYTAIAIAEYVTAYYCKNYFLKHDFYVGDLQCIMFMLQYKYIKKNGRILFSDDIFLEYKDILSVSLPFIESVRNEFGKYGFALLLQEFPTEILNNSYISKEDRDFIKDIILSYQHKTTYEIYRDEGFFDSDLYKKAISRTDQKVIFDIPKH